MVKNQAQNIDIELIETIKSREGHFWAKYTNQAPTEVPPLITKKWLCWHFRLVSPTGRAHYQQLYRVVLTDQVITEIGMKPAEVRSRTLKTFSAQASARLKMVLCL